jgi:hypothetical protein
MEITPNTTICPILSIGKTELILCSPLCAMIKTYNGCDGQPSISYCGLCLNINK